MAILGLGVVAFTAAVVIREQFDPNDDRLQPAYTIWVVLVLVGMVLPLLSAIPVRHIGWRLILYVVVAYAVGFAAFVVLGAAALIAFDLAGAVW